VRVGERSGSKKKRKRCALRTDTIEGVLRTETETPQSVVNKPRWVTFRGPDTLKKKKDRRKEERQSEETKHRKPAY